MSFDITNIIVFCFREELLICQPSTKAMLVVEVPKLCMKLISISLRLRGLILDICYVGLILCYGFMTDYFPKSDGKYTVYSSGYLKLLDPFIS